MGLSSSVLTLEDRTPRDFLGISGLRGVSGPSPDTPSLRAAKTLFVGEEV
jgi:hypothetical protein